MTRDEARALFDRYFPTDDDLERVRQELIGIEAESFVDGNSRNTIRQIVYDWLNEGLPKFSSDRDGIFQEAVDLYCAGDVVDEEDWTRFIDGLRED